jgi:nucleoside-diphosphate-sugar epimerase
VIIYNGAAGGLGRHLSAAASKAGIPTHAIRARLEDRSGLRQELAGISPVGRVTLIQLAALVSVPACEADPEGARTTNVTRARHVLEDVIAWSQRERATMQVIYVSTGHVYATPANRIPIAEGSPVLPRSVYARTKLEAEEVLGSLAASAGVAFVVARIFGLMAPRQASNYLLPALIDRVQRSDVINIPGLENVRDYLDARDVCRDLVRLCSADVEWPDGLLNICSGEPVRVRDVLEAVATLMNPSMAAQIMNRATAAAGRPDDVPWLVGDPSRFVRWTGDQPRQISLKQTVRDAIRVAE